MLLMLSPILSGTERQGKHARVLLDTSRAARMYSVIPFPISGSICRTAAKKPYHAARRNWRTRVRSSTAVNGFGRTASGFCIAMLCAAMLSVDSDI